jgi:hypothetical protein
MSQSFKAKLTAIRRILGATSWALVTVGREHTKVVCDLTPSESIDAIRALGDAADTLVTEREEEAHADELDSAVDATRRIANGGA